MEIYIFYILSISFIFYEISTFYKVLFSIKLNVRTESINPIVLKFSIPDYLYKFKCLKTNKIYNKKLGSPYFSKKNNKEIIGVFGDKVIFPIRQKIRVFLLISILIFIGYCLCFFSIAKFGILFCFVLLYYFIIGVNFYSIFKNKNIKTQRVEILAQQWIDYDGSDVYFVKFILENTTVYTQRNKVSKVGESIEVKYDPEFPHIAHIIELE